jgi:hypothetical protein
MRNNSLELIMTRTKWAKRFLREMLLYFREYNIGKLALQEMGIKNLYRGVDESYKIQKEFKDNAFISTTSIKDIAQSFAKTTGLVFKIDVETLPDDVFIVKIDDSIADHLYEDEFLFLPCTFMRINSYTTFSYKCNDDVLQMMQRLSKVGGAQKNNTKSFITTDMKRLNVLIPKSTIENLSENIVIWWRAIVNLPIEILQWRQLPKDETEVEQYFRTVVYKIDDNFMNKTSFIPEFQRLRAIKKKTEQETTQFKSYFVHMALYDTNTHTVKTMFYGCPINVANEVYDVSRLNEVEECIKKEFSEYF